MYNKFQELLRERGISTYKVSKKTNIAQSTFSDWKNGKSVPKQDKIDEIARFFEIDPDIFKVGNPMCL